MVQDTNGILYFGADYGVLETDPSAGILFRSLADRLPDSLKVFGDIWSISETAGS